MVIKASIVGPRASTNHRQTGALMTELLVAMALLTGVLLPVAYSFSSERRLARASYQKAVAMELVDGEIEALAAGEWKSFKPGSQNYSVKAGAATNLPPGKFVLTVNSTSLKLEWQPAIKDQGGSVVREVTVR